MEGDFFKKKEPLMFYYPWMIVALMVGILIGTLWGVASEKARFAERIYTESEVYNIGVGLMGKNYTSPPNVPVACWVGNYDNTTPEYIEFFNEVMKPLYAGSAVCFKTKDVKSEKAEYLRTG